jgi:hypothetical protein
MLFWIRQSGSTTLLANIQVLGPLPSTEIYAPMLSFLLIKAKYADDLNLLLSVLGICDILVRIRVRRFVLLTKMNPDPDPTPDPTPTPDLTPFFSDYGCKKLFFIFYFFKFFSSYFFYNLLADTLSSVLKSKLLLC